MTNGDSRWGRLTAELQTEVPHHDLMKFMEEQRAEKEIPVILEGLIHKNIENELNKAKSITPADKIRDHFEKVEAELSDFHGCLLAFFTIHEEMGGIDSQKSKAATKKQKGFQQNAETLLYSGGSDETRTRGLLRDRQAF